MIEFATSGSTRTRLATAAIGSIGTVLIAVASLAIATIATVTIAIVLPGGVSSTATTRARTWQ